MTLKEVVDVLKTERQCVERQTCDRDCANCDLLLPTEDVLKAYSMAIECIELMNARLKNESISCL